MVDADQNTEVHLSLSIEKMMKMQNNDTFCKDAVKLLNEKKLLYPHGYFINDGKLMHKVVREGNKSLHSIVLGSH